MQLRCPECGELIPAENINIQAMAAVCPACATVFPFSLPETKVKRRKVKQPDRISLNESEQDLEMSFRTNFRLDRSETFISSLVLALVFGFLTLLLSFGSLMEGVPLMLPLAFGLVSLGAFYRLALVAYNKTYISMNDEQIEVTRRPLPALFDTTTRASLAGVTAFGYEETAASRKEAYDTPRYRLYAESSDGSRKPILNDLIEEYALFISQRLNEALDTEAEDEVEISRLLDEAPAQDDPIQDEAQNQSQDHKSV